MPIPTPSKIEQVRMFGGAAVEIRLAGDTYDDATPQLYSTSKNNAIFVHPFDDVEVIEGQATIGLEILSQTEQALDYLFVPGRGV